MTDNNTKTHFQSLTLSHLPKNTRIDLYKFLIDNHIKFKKDSNGEYNATIHLLNPQYYTEDLKEKNPSKSFPLSDIPPVNNKTKPTPDSLPKGLKKTASEPNFNSHNPESNTKNQSSLLSPPTVSSQRINNYNETFSKTFPRFYNEVKPLIGIRAKKTTYFQLMYIIEELYSLRFIHDSSLLKQQLSKGKEIILDNPFPLFIFQFYTNKYNKKTIIDQHALNLLISLDFYRKNSKEVELFIKFFNEEYDNDDLVFFLFMRSCIEKESKISFVEKAQDEISLQHMEDRDLIETEIYLTSQMCLNIANILFGSDEVVLIKAFMQKIEMNMTKEKNAIDAMTLLAINIDDYHQSRAMQKDNSLKQVKSNCNDNDDDNKGRYEKPNDDDNDAFFNDVQAKEYNSCINQSNNNLKLQVEQCKSPPNNPSTKPKDNTNAKTKEVKSNNKATTEENNEQFYQSLIAFYHNEDNSPQADHASVIKEFLFTYIQEKEINIFFTKLFNYDTNDTTIEAKLSKLKNLILTKISNLINIVSMSDRKAWIESLKASYTDPLTMKHYEQLQTVYMTILSTHQILSIPEDIVGQFCNELLMTKELMAQITKVIKDNFY